MVCTLDVLSKVSFRRNGWQGGAVISRLASVVMEILAAFVRKVAIKRIGMQRWYWDTQKANCVGFCEGEKRWVWYGLARGVVRLWV